MPQCKIIANIQILFDYSKILEYLHILENLHIFEYLSIFEYSNVWFLLKIDYICFLIWWEKLCTNIFVFVFSPDEHIRSSLLHCLQIPSQSSFFQFWISSPALVFPRINQCMISWRYHATFKYSRHLVHIALFKSYS